MIEKSKRRLMAWIYALAMAVMAASLTATMLRPKAIASTCPAEGQPCNLSSTGGYGCTGGLNGAPPIPGCGCDLANFCTSEPR